MRGPRSASRSKLLLHEPDLMKSMHIRPPEIRSETGVVSSCSIERFLLSNLGRRRSTVEAAVQWVVDHRGPATRLEIVETGIYSGVHGVPCSTRIFGKLCQELWGPLPVLTSMPNEYAPLVSCLPSSPVELSPRSETL
jgi:hypothetical protein